MTHRILAALAAASMFAACGPQEAADESVGASSTDAMNGRASRNVRDNRHARDLRKGTQERRTTTSAIAMQVRESDAQPGPFSSSFSIGATNTLFYGFDVPAAKSGSHTARFEVYMPGDNAYQVFDVQFAAGTAASVDQVQADAISGGYRVWAQMPVAATMIEQYQLTGTWTTLVFLDDVQVASSSYELTP